MLYEEISRNNKMKINFLYLPMDNYNSCNVGAVQCKDTGHNKSYGSFPRKRIIMAYSMIYLRQKMAPKSLIFQSLMTADLFTFQICYPFECKPLFLLIHDMLSEFVWNLYNILYQQQLMVKILCLLLLLGVAVSFRGKELVFTQVTCIYDIGRGSMKSSQGRSYQHYLSSFTKLLKTSSNLIVFGDQLTENFVWNRRQPHNTVFIRKQLEELKSQWFYPHVVRINKMKDGPNRKNIQFRINQYNAIVFSKLILMKEAVKHDKFHTDMMMWIDAGIFSHLIPQQFSSHKSNIAQDIFRFVSPQWTFFTSTVKNMDFNTSKFINRPAANRSTAAFTGGYVQMVQDMAHIMQNFLRIALQVDEMDTEQIFYEMMPIKFPYLIPVTTSKSYDQLYKRYRVNYQVSRKPQIIRQFKGKFQGQKLTILEDASYEDSSLHRDYFFQLNQQVYLLNRENSIYKSVLTRLSYFLVVLALLYALVLHLNHDLNRREQSKYKEMQRI